MFSPVDLSVQPLNAFVSKHPLPRMARIADQIQATHQSGVNLEPMGESQVGREQDACFSSQPIQPLTILVTGAVGLLKSSTAKSPSATSVISGSAVN